MVNQGLDEAILQIFEEKEDMFYWPVKSQKDARAFLKALTGKGVKHEMVSNEIGEFEQNFTAWRTGLGRQGIGKRVIERINRPVQEVLLSDEESSSEEDSESEEESDDEVPMVNGIISPAHRNGDSTDSAPSPVADRRNQTTTTVRSNAPSNLNTSPADVQNKDKPVTKAAPWAKVTATGNNEDMTVVSSSATETSILGEITSSDVKTESAIPMSIEKIDTAEQTECATVTDNTEFARSNEKSDTDTSIEVSLAEKTMSVSLDEKMENSTSPSTSPEENITDYEEESKQDLSDKPYEADEIAIEQELQVKGSVPMAEAEDDLEEDENSENALEKNASENSESVSEEESSDDASETRVNNDVAAVEIQGVHASSTEKSEEKSPSQSPEPRELVIAPTSISSEGQETWEDLESSSEYSSDEEDITENYDSDLDAEILENEEDPQGHWRKALEAVTRAKTNKKDGQGFIYLLTDSPQDAEKRRVKVGASRCPQARFQQAALFNVDISLENMISVNKRAQALKEVCEKLNSLQIADNPGWFSGDMEKIQEVVSEVTDKYPLEATDC